MQFNVNAQDFSVIPASYQRHTSVIPASHRWHLSAMILSSIAVLLEVLMKNNIRAKMFVVLCWITTRVRDYRESKKRYRNYIITFWVITPLKRNAPIEKISFLSCQFIDLEFVYICDLLFKVFYNDYWDCYEHITVHYRTF